MFTLEGKRALVTGASRGLGWQMAKSLAQQGAHVFLNARDASLLQQKVNELLAEGLRVESLPFDVTDSDALNRAVSQLEDLYQGVDILIANAGIQHRSPISEFEKSDFTRVINTNLTAVWELAKVCSRSMVKNSWGRIIFTGSITAELGRATISGYIAAKGGVHALCRQLAVELGDKGVTVNTIAPGYFSTEMNSALVSDKDFSEWVCSRVPVRRWGSPQEIGPAAVFLASNEAAYVNGHVLTVDGGFSISM